MHSETQSTVIGPEKQIEGIRYEQLKRKRKGDDHSGQFKRGGGRGRGCGDQGEAEEEDA